jgi:hypothetical protein
MSALTKRVQAVLTEEQFATLTHIAREKKKPVSILIREAVEEVYLKKTMVDRKRSAFTALTALGAPVADWEIMEREIEQGAVDE